MGEVTISFPQAALGSSVVVPTLDEDERIKTKVAYYHNIIYDDVAADPNSGSGSSWTEFQNAISQWDTWINARNPLLRGFLSSAPLAIKL